MQLKQEGQDSPVSLTWLPDKFWVNWPFNPRELVQNRLSTCLPWRSSWTSDWNDFSCFWITNGRDTSYQVSSQLAFWVKEKNFEIDFQDGSHGIHLGYLIGTVLSIFDQQVNLMLSTKFPVNWPFGSSEKVQIDFQHGRPSWISDRNDSCYFQSSSQLAFQFRRKKLI